MTSGAFAVKCQYNRLYIFGLQSLCGGPNFIIITKEYMKDGIYDDHFLKCLFQLKRANFKRSPIVEKNIRFTYPKRRRKKYYYKQSKSCHHQDRCKVMILAILYLILNNYPETQLLYLPPLYMQ